jgi:two-component system response regulator AtoC
MSNRHAIRRIEDLRRLKADCSKEDCIASIAIIIESLFTSRGRPPTPSRREALDSLFQHARTFLGSDHGAPFVDIDSIDEQFFRVRGPAERAAGGTLFLREVSGLSMASQVKLLVVIAAMRVRVVAATQSDLADRVRKNLFHEELYRRLSARSVVIAPLAERQDDIPELALTFVRWSAERMKKRIAGIAPEALRALRSYEFPGNVRELKNIIERAVILARGRLITERDLALWPDEPRGSGDFFHMALRDDGTPWPIDDVERAYVGRVLEHHEGHRTAAAQALGISYPTFLKRLRELKLE